MNTYKATYEKLDQSKQKTKTFTALDFELAMVNALIRTPSTKWVIIALEIQ